jgi:hypothetical protein
MPGTRPGMTNGKSSKVSNCPLSVALAHNIKYRVFWIKDRLFRFDTAWLFEMERPLEAAKDVSEPSVLHTTCGATFAAEFSARRFG